jgi:hypothetical protein
MAEDDPRAEFEQAVPDGRGDRVSRQPQLGRRSPQQRDLAGRLGGGQQQQPPRRLGQPLYAAHEARLDTALQLAVARRVDAAPERRGRVVMWQLEQGQRVPTRLGEDARPHVLVPRGAVHRRQQLARVRRQQAAEPQLRQSGELVGVERLPHRQHERDRLGLQAPGRERERLHGRPVQPLRIVDEAQQRRLLSRL